MRKIIRAILFPLAIGLSDPAQSQTTSPSRAALDKAEIAFWEAAASSGNHGLIAAYLLHFVEGRFVEPAARLYHEKTGGVWTAAAANSAAWRDLSIDATLNLEDSALTGRWNHTAQCDINFFVQDVIIESTQTFTITASGMMSGRSRFHSGDNFEGHGDVLGLRRNKSVVTYVTKAENNYTGTEIHIGILNLRQANGQLLTRGWEMNTAGAYCDVSGRKAR